jgi:MoxR-like ATPase
MSRTILLTVLLSLLIPAARALADDRLSPRGAPWWRELARCGGLALAVRDQAVDRKAPPERAAEITRAMNAYLDAGAAQLRRDRGIEPSPAKRSVYQAAAKAWEEFKKSPDSAATLDAALATCAAQLEEHGMREGNRQ